MGILINPYAFAAAVPALFTLDFTGGELPEEVDFERASSGSYFDGDGVLQSATTDEPRFDHDPVSHALKGLLIEPQRTNLITQSRNLDPAGNWDVTNTTLTTDQAVGPDGGTSMDRLNETVGSGVHFIDDNSIPVTANPYTASIVAKAGTRSWLQFGHASVTAAVMFDLTNGVEGTISGTLAAHGITPLGNGLYRLSVTFNHPGIAGSRGLFALIARGNTPLDSYAGDTGQNLFLGDAQFELGAYASSIIPTAGSSVTRAADVASFTVPSGVGSLRYTFDDNSTQDVAVSEGAYQVPTDLNRRHIKKIEGFA